jgi:predicted DCC family thiol-disulfide oxidoreductase YuxK
MGSPDPINHPVILFDGVCNLCNGSVLFIIKRDPKARFYFAALQSDVGNSQLKKFGLPAAALNSVLLVKEGKLYQKSNAALEIAKHLRGLWPALYILKIVPSFLRDGVYTWIARNRYRWFGKKEACMIPTPELKSRFLV